MGESSLVGRLLVATPDLADPNFARTVVLVLQHDEDGALGVVVNRATPVPVGEVLPTWQTLTSSPQVLFQGGPVARDSALGLARVEDGTESPIGWRRLEGPVGLVDLDTPTELVSGGLDDLRIFAGYAGWNAGQLEAEIGTGSWYVVDARPGDAFVGDPTTLWRAVLRRQAGELALVSTYPDDPDHELSASYNRRMSTELGTAPQTITDERPETSFGDGDHERFSHYVKKHTIVESAVMGSPVVALCGKVWVPSRDPKKFPVCPTCQEIYESLRDGGDDDAGNP